MKNEIIWGEILQIRFLSRGQSALQSIPWTKSLDPDLCLLDLWIGSSTVFFREVAARWRRVCVMSPDAVQSSHFSHTSLKWPLFLFPPAPFGSSQSGDNGVMVCVGKTELCSTARNWFFFRICVCGSKAPSARMGFPPIEGPGPGHRQLRRPGPSSLPVLWEFPKHRPQEISYTLQSSGTRPGLHSYFTFVTTLQTAPTPFEPSVIVGLGLWMPIPSWAIYIHQLHACPFLQFLQTLFSSHWNQEKSVPE